MPWSGSWAGYWSGGPTPGTVFSLASARAVGARTLRVTFTHEPLYQSPIGAYDAGNLEHWLLVREDTSRAVPLLGTRQVSGDALSLDLLLAEPFASSALTLYRVTASHLLSALGQALVDPTSLEVYGMPGVREVASRPQPLLDVFNPQTAGDRINGALQLGTDGDYQLESGTQLLRKLVVRRLLTALGEYYHLADTDYGAGLQPKELLRPSDLVVLRARLELQLLREPEFSKATVSLTLESSGELDVRSVLVMKQSGQQLTVQFPLNPSGGSQV